MKAKTNKEKRYLNKVAELGCIVCRIYEDSETMAEIHHIREGQGMSQRASNYLVIPLCPAHHRTGGVGVALHADQAIFEGLYGSELELLADTIEELNG